MNRNWRNIHLYKILWYVFAPVLNTGFRQSNPETTALEMMSAVKKFVPKPCNFLQAYHNIISASAHKNKVVFCTIRYVCFINCAFIHRYPS